MRYSDEELDAIAESDARERKEEQLNQVRELIACNTMSDLKTFLMKHLIGV